MTKPTGPDLSPEKRVEIVMQTNASFAIEGFAPDDQDLELQRKFIAGEITTADMLAAAAGFAAQAAKK